MQIHIDEPRIELVTRGDDAASARSANVAIAETFTHGILRNVSVMAVGPAVAHAAEVLAPLEGLCVGCHLSLNAEWTHPPFRPLLAPGEVPSLVNEHGIFLPAPQDTAARGFEVSHVMAEAQAQLDALRAAGFDVRYLDGHMGVTRLEGVAERIARFCETEGLIDADAQVKGLHGIPTQPAATLQDRWVQQSTVLPPGRYVALAHPTYDDEEMRQVVNADHPPGKAAADRDLQRRAFLDARWPDLCQEHGIRPVRYDDPTRVSIA